MQPYLLALGLLSCTAVEAQILARVIVSTEKFSKDWPFFITRLELKNDSKQSVRFRFDPEAIKFVVVDAAGTAIAPDRGAPYNKLSPSPKMLRLAPGQTVRKDITSHAAGPGEGKQATLDLGWNQYWWLPLVGKGPFQLRGSFTAGKQEVAIPPADIPNVPNP